MKKKRPLNGLMCTLFLLLGCTSNTKPTLLVPSGSPFFSVASTLEEVDETVTIGPDLLPVSFMKGEYDFIIAPITLGAKLFNLGQSTYPLSAVLGWSNLHILSRTEVKTIDDLNNQNVIAFAEHNTPGIMLRLATKDISVNVSYFKAVGDVSGAFINREYDYALVSEPLLSKLIKDVEGPLYTFSLQDVPHLPRIAQFGLFSRKGLDNGILSSYMVSVSQSIRTINTTPSSYVDNVYDLSDEFKSLGKDILINSIERSDFEYMSAMDARNDVIQFFYYLQNADKNIIGEEPIDVSFFR